jgi:hypothetical protein
MVFIYVAVDGVWKGKYMQGGHSTTYNRSIKRMTVGTDSSGRFSGDGSDDMGTFTVSEGLFTSPDLFFWKQQYATNGRLYEFHANINADGNEMYGKWIDTGDGGSNAFMLSRNSPATTPAPQSVRNLVGWLQNRMLTMSRRSPTHR